MNVTHPLGVRLSFAWRPMPRCFHYMNLFYFEIPLSVFQSEAFFSADFRLTETSWCSFPLPDQRLCSSQSSENFHAFWLTRSLGLSQTDFSV
jgi:hypothetical protein